MSVQDYSEKSRFATYTNDFKKDVTNGDILIPKNIKGYEESLKGHKKECDLN